MPHPAPGPAVGDRSQRSFRVYTAADLDQLIARAGLAPARRRRIQAAAAVTGFRVTSYITDELIDWSAAPDDPIYRLYFPDEAIPAAAHPDGRPAAGPPDSGAPALPGVRHASHDTVLVVPAREPGRHCYALTRPGLTWPARAPWRTRARMGMMPGTMTLSGWQPCSARREDGRAGLAAGPGADAHSHVSPAAHGADMTA